MVLSNHSFPHGRHTTRQSELVLFCLLQKIQVGMLCKSCSCTSVRFYLTTVLRRDFLEYCWILKGIWRRRMCLVRSLDMRVLLGSRGHYIQIRLSRRSPSSLFGEMFLVFLYSLNSFFMARTRASTSIASRRLGKTFE